MFKNLVGVHIVKFIYKLELCFDCIFKISLKMIISISKFVILIFFLK